MSAVYPSHGFDSNPYGQPPMQQQGNVNYAPPVSTQPYGFQPPVGHHTTVVVQQQPTTGRPPLRDWNSGTLDCFNDMGICLFGWFCGPCHACGIASDMGETGCIVCCVPNWLTALRTKLRTQQNITGSICNDCLTVAFCGPCTLCQMAREIKTCQMNGTFYN